MAKLIDITGKALVGEWGVDDTEGTGIPVLRTANFTNTGTIDFSNVVTRGITKKAIEEKYLRHGDIVIEKSGGSDKQPVGRVVFFDGPEQTYLFNNFTGLLRVRDITRWLPRYVFYSLFSKYRTGGTRKFENKTTGLHNLQIDAYVNSVEIIDADIKSQKEIVAALDQTRSIIEKRQQELSVLDDLVKARFVEIFGNPISNPMRWEVCRLKECLEKIENGKSFVCSDKSRTGTSPAVLKLSAATYGDYRPSENKALLDKKLFVEDAEVHPGDVLFTRKNTPELVGMAAYVHETPPHLMMPDLIFRLVPNEKMNPVFLWQLINCKEFRPVIKRISVGSAKSMSNISKERLGEVSVICPPKTIQERLIPIIRQVDKSKFRELGHFCGFIFHSRALAAKEPFVDEF